MVPGSLRGLFASLQFRLVLGFALVLALALGLVGVLTGLAANRQTVSFEAELELAEAARVSEFVSGHYGEEYGWPESNAELQMPMEQAAAIAGLRIIMFDAQGEMLAGSHDPYQSTGGSSDMGTVSHEPAWRAEEPIRWEPAWDEPEKPSRTREGAFRSCRTESWWVPSAPSAIRNLPRSRSPSV